MTMSRMSSPSRILIRAFAAALLLFALIAFSRQGGAVAEGGPPRRMPRRQELGRQELGRQELGRQEPGR